MCLLLKNWSLSSLIASNPSCSRRLRSYDVAEAASFFLREHGPSCFGPCPICCPISSSPGSALPTLRFNAARFPMRFQNILYLGCGAFEYYLSNPNLLQFLGRRCCVIALCRHATTAPITRSGFFRPWH